MIDSEWKQNINNFYETSIIMIKCDDSNCINFMTRHQNNDVNNNTLKNVKDTKGAIRIRISKKNRQHNGQKIKHKRTNNDPQNIHIKLKIEQHKPHQKTGGELRCSGRVSSSCFTSGTLRIGKMTTIDLDQCQSKRM